MLGLIQKIQTMTSESLSHYKTGALSPSTPGGETQEGKHMTTTINGITYKLIKKPFNEVSILTYIADSGELINTGEHRMKPDSINGYCDFQNQCIAIDEMFN